MDQVQSQNKVSLITKLNQFAKRPWPRSFMQQSYSFRGATGMGWLIMANKLIWHYISGHEIEQQCTVCWSQSHFVCAAHCNYKLYLLVDLCPPFTSEFLQGSILGLGPWMCVPLSLCRMSPWRTVSPVPTCLLRDCLMLYTSLVRFDHSAPVCVQISVPMLSSSWLYEWRHWEMHSELDDWCVLQMLRCILRWIMVRVRVMHFVFANCVCV